MIRYRQFRENDKTDPEQRTILVETVLYDSDGSEVVTNSRKTSIGQRKQEHADALASLERTGEQADHISDEVGKMAVEVGIPAPAMERVMDAKATKATIPRRAE